MVFAAAKPRPWDFGVEGFWLGVPDPRIRPPLQLRVYPKGPRPTYHDLNPKLEILSPKPLTWGFFSLDPVIPNQKDPDLKL